MTNVINEITGTQDEAAANKPPASDEKNRKGGAKLKPDETSDTALFMGYMFSSYSDAAEERKKRKAEYEKLFKLDECGTLLVAKGSLATPASQHGAVLVSPSAVESVATDIAAARGKTRQ
jgi:hypothetical protein